MVSHKDKDEKKEKKSKKGDSSSKDKDTTEKEKDSPDKSKAKEEGKSDEGKKSKKSKKEEKSKKARKRKASGKEAPSSDGDEEEEEETKSLWTGTLMLSVFAAVGGSFQFGYHIGCMNVPHKVMRNFFAESHINMTGEVVTLAEIDKFQWAIAVSIFAFGGMVGSLPAGSLANCFGRKVAMFVSNGFAVIAAGLLTAAKYVNIYYLVIAGRFLIGICAGMSSELVPMYISEISPNELRTRIGNVHQVVVALALLVSQIVGLPVIFGTETLWPFVFGFTIIPVVWQVAALPFCPESPKYTLHVMKDTERGESDLMKLRHTEDVEAERIMIQEEAALLELSKISFGALIRGKLRWPLLISVLLMLSLQLSGISVAYWYSSIIFVKAGIPRETAAFATIGVGIVNLLATILAIFLVNLSWCGRRLLLLIGLMGMLTSTLALVVFIALYNMDMVENANSSYFSVACVFMLVFFFATGPSSIPWYFVHELFEWGARASACAMASLAYWFANFLVGSVFLLFYSALHHYAFLMFVASLALSLYFVYVYVPETKGRAVAEIYAELKRGKSVFKRELFTKLQ